MPMRLAIIGLAVLGSVVADDLDVPVAALEADSECPASDVPCALNALQRRAQSGSAGSEGTEPAATAEDALDGEGEEEEEDEEVATFGDDEVTADAHEAAEADVEALGADEEQELSAVEAGAEQADNFFSRRRQKKASGAKSKCCLCKNGGVSWSAQGICSYCKSGIQRKTTPKQSCQTSKNSRFPGSKACLQQCVSYFRPSGHSPARQKVSGAKSKCCLCKNGGVSWSPQGICSYCKSGIQRKTTPKQSCQTSKNSRFPGSKACLQQCVSYFRPSGHSPAHHPSGGCSSTTDGTCAILGCASSRGGKQAVQCVKGKCVCKPGYCSNGHKCTLGYR